MNWKDSFRAALVEVDSTKLMALIQEVETAMAARSESLPKVSNEELQAISDARCTLRILKSHAPAASVEGTKEKPYGHDRGFVSSVGR